MNFPVPIPFVESLGFDLLRFEDGESKIALDLRDELCNSWSVVHGGVTMTLLDVAMAHAVRSAVSPGTARAAAANRTVPAGIGAAHAVNKNWLNGVGGRDSGCVGKNAFLNPARSETRPPPLGSRFHASRVARSAMDHSDYWPLR